MLNIKLLTFERALVLLLEYMYWMFHPSFLCQLSWYISTLTNISTHLQFTHLLRISEVSLINLSSQIIVVAWWNRWMCCDDETGQDLTKILQDIYYTFLSRSCQDPARSCHHLGKITKDLAQTLQHLGNCSYKNLSWSCH